MTQFSSLWPSFGPPLSANMGTCWRDQVWPQDMSYIGVVGDPSGQRADAAIQETGLARDIVLVTILDSNSPESHC